MDRVSGELPELIAAAVRALDARAGERAARVDASRVAGRVLERLRREGALAPRVWWRRPAALRIAAAVVLVAAAGAIGTLARQHGAQTAVRLPVAIPAMDSLSTQQLEAVLTATGQLRWANFAPATTSNGLDSLSEQQLQRVLASLADAAGS